jgi:3-oxoacyl-(acyl-carrier-protein) synthase
MAITGMGVISAAGTGVSQSLDSMAAGVRNCSPVASFPTELEYPVFEVQQLDDRYRLKKQSTLGFAYAAVDQAVEEAGLSGGLGGLRLGVCMGTTVASQINDIEFYRSFLTSGSAPMGPVDRFIFGDLAHNIARRLGSEGLCLSVVNACSSGVDAIGVALSWLRADLCDIAIAGGSDGMSRVPYAGFGSLSITSKKPCMPFDRSRTGLNLGEGAAVLVIEKPESAAKRGARSEFSIFGYGSCADAYHLTAPRPDGAGLRCAINTCLDDAAIGAGDISFVNAHGTATPENDKVEGRMLRKVFGSGLKFVSTKGYTGHTLGAAGAVEAVFTAASLRCGWIPRCAGFENTDEEIGIAPVSENTPVSGDFAMSTSLAFGGNNSAIVIGRSG